jgi:hypothetical protein
MISHGATAKITAKITVGETCTVPIMSKALLRGTRVEFVSSDNKPYCTRIQEAGGTL